MHTTKDETKYANVSAAPGDLYFLEEDYTNHAGDEFRKGEALTFTNNNSQLTRLGAKLGDPAIAFYVIIKSNQ